MTDAERKAAMEKERTDLDAWAKSNGIDIKYLFGGFGPGGGRGDRGEGFGPGDGNGRGKMMGGARAMRNGR
jgi:hypothetical protein